MFESRRFTAVLFDLDGTLIDTAPDMVAVLQSIQSDRNFEPVTYELGRAYVSNGSVGMLKLAFPDASADDMERMRLEFLDRYEARIAERSTVFPGLDSLVDRLDHAQLPWGVVTNKPGYLTDALMAQLGLAERLACCVSGDTLPQRKPDPAPLHFACEQAGIRANETLYVGDSSRDIDAGRAAGMGTVAAGYGYITPDDSATSWGADALAADIEELTQIVLKAVNLGP